MALSKKFDIALKKSMLKVHCWPGFFRAFMEQPRSLQEQAVRMMEIIHDASADDDERSLSLDLLFEILYPDGGKDA